MLQSYVVEIHYSLSYQTPRNCHVNFASLPATHCSKHVGAQVRSVIKRSLLLYILVVASIWLAGCARYQSVPLSPNQSAAGLESRSLSDPALRDFVEEFSERDVMVVPRIAKTNWPPAKWDLPTLTLVAFYYHPALDMARAQWNVAKAGVTTAGGRPNPVLSVVPGYSINPASGVSPWLPLVSLDVPIETAGKRDYRIAHAQKVSDVARLNIASTAWQVRGNLRLSLLDWASAQRRADLLQHQLELQQQILDLLEQRFRAGTVVRTDLTLARVALARTSVDLADAARQSAEARVRIADALGLTAKAIVGERFDFPLRVSPEATEELTAAAARQQALLGRADILAGLADYAASESALQLEIAKQYPDVHLNPGYQFDQGEHKWSLGLSAELPVLNQNKGPIAEASARREEAAAHFTVLQAKVIGEIDRALAARSSALEQLTNQIRLAKLASDQATAVQEMFDAGAADKLELSSAQLETAVTDLAELDAQIKAQQAIAQLEDAIQRPIEGWPSLERGRSAQAKSQ